MSVEHNTAQEGGLAVATERAGDRVPTSGPRRSPGGVLVAAALMLASACSTGVASTTGPPSSSPAAVADASTFDAATRDDAEFNRQFRHEFADVDDVRMHYVTGGSGPPLVLLHGWPQ